MEPSQKRALARTVSGKFRKPGTHWSDWLPSPPGWFTRWNQSNLCAASAPGFFDREGPPVKKLLSYSPRGMWTFFALFADYELSAFHGHMTFHLVWALLVPLVFCFICATIDGYEPIVDGVPSVARKWVILFENKMRTSSNEFRGLVAYVLGGYVARAFMMWHARRKNYASFCGTTRNLILQLSAAVPMDAAGGMSAEEVARLRSDLGRWAVLTHEVAMLKARGEMDSEEGRQYLLKAGLMEEGEWEAMVAGDRHTTVLWWVQMVVQRLNEGGVMGTLQQRTCSEAVSMMRAQANDLMSSLDRDLPYPYASLLGMLVKTNVALMSLWRSSELYLQFCGSIEVAGQTWGTAHVKNPNCDLVGNPTNFPNENGWHFFTMVFLELTILFLWNTSYKAMYDLGKTLSNPFLNWRIDIAHEAIHAGLRRLAEQLLGNPRVHLPPAMARLPLKPAFARGRVDSVM